MTLRLSSRTGIESLLAILIMPVVAGACRAPSPDDRIRSIRTTMLGPVGDSASAFEPHVAIDRSNPDRVVAGAQFGSGYNRGGLWFGIWGSEDAGTTWRGGEVVPRALRRPPTMAADLTLAFADADRLYLLGLSADTVWEGVPDASLALAVSADGGQAFDPRVVFGTRVNSSATVFEGSDKPWMTVDGHATSPYRGTLYFAWTRVRVRLDTDPVTVTRRLVLSVSRNGGRDLTPPVSIADDGIGAQLAVRPDGTLDIVWLAVAPADGQARDRILHALSRDGGRTFSPTTAVDRASDASQALDLPTLAANTAGSILSCWTRGPRRGVTGTGIWCSVMEELTGWSRPEPVGDPHSAAAYGYPAVAAGGGAWWLLGYRADSIAIRVTLSRSDDGRSFSVIDTLATVALSGERFCPRPGLPCRADAERFTPGDYVGMAGGSRRLAAAFVVPDTERVDLRSNLFVSIIDLFRAARP